MTDTSWRHCTGMRGEGFSLSPNNIDNGNNIDNNVGAALVAAVTKKE